MHQPSDVLLVGNHDNGFENNFCLVPLSYLFEKENVIQMVATSFSF